MSAMYAIYTDSYGDVDGEEAFVVITDGTKTEILFPLGTSPEDIEDLRTAIGARIWASGVKDPEELLESLTYNMPLEVSVTEPFKTYEEAVSRAQEFMQVLNDFDPEPYELFEPIITDGMKEE